MKLYPRAVVAGVTGGIVACALISSGPVGYGVLAVSALGLYGFAIFAEPVMTVVHDTQKAVIATTPIKEIVEANIAPKLNIRYVTRVAA